MASPKRQNLSGDLKAPRRIFKKWRSKKREVGWKPWDGVYVWGVKRLLEDIVGCSSVCLQKLTPPPPCTHIPTRTSFQLMRNYSWWRFVSMESFIWFLFNSPIPFLFFLRKREGRGRGRGRTLSRIHTHHRAWCEARSNDLEIVTWAEISSRPSLQFFFNVPEEGFSSHRKNSVVTC